MIKRREFPRTVRVAVIKRATRCVGKISDVYCEQCGAPTKGRFQIDHIRADGLLGEPILENAMILCEACFGVKNPEDTRKIARAKRREARHTGAVRPKQTIRSAGFAPTDRPKHEPKPSLPPRRLYQEIKQC